MFYIARGFGGRDAISLHRSVNLMLVNVSLSWKLIAREEKSQAKLAMSRKKRPRKTYGKCFKFSVVEEDISEYLFSIRTALVCFLFCRVSLTHFSLANKLTEWYRVKLHRFWVELSSKSSSYHVHLCYTTKTNHLINQSLSNFIKTFIMYAMWWWWGGSEVFFFSITAGYLSPLLILLSSSAAGRKERKAKEKLFRLSPYWQFHFIFVCYFLICLSVPASALYSGVLLIPKSSIFGASRGRKRISILWSIHSETTSFHHSLSHECEPAFVLNDIHEWQIAEIT